MKKALISLSLFFVFTPSLFAFTVSNFDSPEAVLVDPDNGAYYVSNVKGKPSEKDGNGYIAKINASGTIVIQKFIGGRKDELILNAPKGIALLGDTLFVADIDSIKGFDRKTHKPSVVVDLSGFNVKFLAGVTADRKNGCLYASDTMTNRIFRIDAARHYTVSVYKDSPDLGGPFGLMINPKTRNLMIATLATGRILEIGPAGRIHVVRRGLSGLAGLDYDLRGNLYVSSVEKGEIYRIEHYGRGAFSTLFTGLTTPTLISYDRSKDELLIPSTKSNKVTTVPVKPYNKKY